MIICGYCFDSFYAKRNEFLRNKNSFLMAYTIANELSVEIEKTRADLAGVASELYEDSLCEADTSKGWSDYKIVKKDLEAASKALARFLATV